MVDRRGGGHTQSGPRLPDGDSGRDRGRRSERCWRTEISRVGSRGRSGLVLVSQGVGSGASEGHGRDLSWGLERVAQPR
jgi:hypothetical protein